jgi:hypothetical protein
MPALYLAADPIEAQLLKDYLGAHDIAVQILGSEGWGARGEVPVDQYPRLYLMEPADQPRALALLRQYEQRRHAHGEWRCDCGECSPITFEVCWACQAPRPA